jgi:hypothetical protein
MEMIHTNFSRGNYSGERKAEERRDGFVLPHMWTLYLGQMQQCGGLGSHDKGRAHMEDMGIGRKPKT